MDSEQLKFRIALTMLNGIGNSLARNLITWLGNEEAVFTEKPAVLELIPGIGPILSKGISQQSAVLKRAEAEIEYIHKNNIQCLYYSDDDYPYRLKECPDAPLILYTKTACSLNEGHFVAIVGTRHASEYGKEMCTKLVQGLTKLSNVTIVSGLAYGIDVTAHKSALASELPTLGVVAHGLDRIYPYSHRQIASNMLEQGGLLTEYPSETNPDRQNFVQRNRIIAGVSDAVIVVESGVKGGALITAELGNDYNRDVFAYPGRTTDNWSKGCNALIRQNRAALIESADDLIRAMRWVGDDDLRVKPLPTLFPELTPDEQMVFNCLAKADDGLQVNELALSLSIPFHRLSSLLLDLEFKDMVKSLPGGLYKSVLSTDR